jgi:hypothetical protein
MNFEIEKRIRFEEMKLKAIFGEGGQKNGE